MNLLNIWQMTEHGFQFTGSYQRHSHHLQHLLQHVLVKRSRSQPRTWMCWVPGLGPGASACSSGPDPAGEAGGSAGNVPKTQRCPQGSKDSAELEILRARMCGGAAEIASASFFLLRPPTGLAARGTQHTGRAPRHGNGGFALLALPAGTRALTSFANTENGTIRVTFP